MNPRRFTSPFRIVYLILLLATVCVDISSNLTHASAPAKSSTDTQTQTVAKPVGIGEVAPDFRLVDHHATKVTLSDSKGKSPVVLVFYRGYW